MSTDEKTQKQTVIEDGTEFDGSISSSCDIMLSGKMKGELLAPSLTVEQSGSVHGCVKVEQLVSRGEVSGEIDAQSVELSGRVNDKTVINAETLEVKLSKPEQGLQVTFGECELRVGERPGHDSANTDRPVSEQQSQPAATEQQGTL